MGWCSATEIMDATVSAAEQAVIALLAGYTGPPDEEQRKEIFLGPEGRRVRDEVLRPFVRRIAEVLRDGDWDCIEESDYYDRFGPEMQGMTDKEFRRHQAEVHRDDPERFASWLVDVWAPQERDDV